MVERKLNQPLTKTQKAKAKPRCLRMAVETQVLKSRNNFSWSVTKKRKKNEHLKPNSLRLLKLSFFGKGRQILI